MISIQQLFIHNYHLVVVHPSLWHGVARLLWARSTNSSGTSVCIVKNSGWIVVSHTTPLAGFDGKRIVGWTRGLLSFVKLCRRVDSIRVVPDYARG